MDTGNGQVRPTRPLVGWEQFEDGEYHFPLGDLLRLLWQRLWIIAIVTIVLVGAVVGFTFTQTPSYQASIKILVGQEGDESDIGSEVLGLQQLTATLVEAVETRPVAEGVIKELDLRVSPEEFLAKLDAEQVKGTQLVEVTYEDTSPERAKQIANTVGEVFSRQLLKFSPSEDQITATVWEQAALPDDPVSPNPLRNALISLIVGSMLGVGLALLLEHLDDSWRSPEEAEQVSGVPTCGVIPKFEVVKVAEKEGG